MRSKHLTIIAVGIFLAACHKAPQTKIALPPPTIVTKVVPVPVTLPVPVSMNIPASLPVSEGTMLFEQAEVAFAMSDYVMAIQDYENYLQSVPNGDHVEMALFHAGMAYALQTRPPANWKLATASLTQLVNEHPDSPLKPTATLILSLRSHADELARDAKTRNENLQQLNTELERLKRIDADRRKRP
jgi:TolA-binding protein